MTLPAKSCEHIKVDFNILDIDEGGRLRLEFLKIQNYAYLVKIQDMH